MDASRSRVESASGGGSGNSNSNSNSNNNSNGNGGSTGENTNDNDVPTAAPTIIFQCRNCNTIVGDNFSQVAASQEMQLVCISSE